MLAELLTDYWEAAFAAEWERLEPQLAAAVSDAGRTIAAGGVYELLRGPPAAACRSRGPRSSVSTSRYDHRVEITDGRRSCSCRAPSCGRMCASTATSRGR